LAALYQLEERHDQRPKLFDQPDVIFFMIDELEAQKGNLTENEIKNSK